MTRVWTAAALTAALLGGAAASAGALPVTSGASTIEARHEDLTRGVIAPGAAAAARITGVSVVPVDGRAEVVVALSGDAKVADFALSSPNRVVIDLAGAKLGTRPRRYDGAVRGPVTNIRVSQFRADVVRLVIDLDSAHPYKVTRVAGEVRISVDGGGEFAAWSSSGAPVVARTAPRPTTAAAPAVAVPRPARTAAPDAGAMPVRRVAATRAARPRQQPRITVTYQEAEIRDVLAAFATFSGRTIVVGRDIKGTVTAEIKDQPWDVALQAILSSQGLAASEDVNGIIAVDSYKNLASNQAGEPLVTQIVAVNYANATALAGTIQTLLTRSCGDGGAQDGPGAQGGGERAAMAAMLAAAARGSAAGNGGGIGNACSARGAVSADSLTNSLLVTAAPSQIPSLISYVRELDVRTPQVAIKAKIIFVNRTNIMDLGLTYDLGRGTSQFFSQLVKRTDPSTVRPVDVNGDGVTDAFSGGSPFVGDRVALGGRAFSGLANANNRITSPALSLIYSAALGNYQLTTFLDALQETRLADVQAEPNIVTLDNRRAEILVGQEIPLRVIDASAGAGGAGGAARAQVQLKEIGIILGVTPRITNNRQVLLNVHAENSNAEIGASDVGYIFNKQRADNQVLVGDGETAVVGGLTITSVSRIRTGIPVLSQLPVVGFLFGRTTKSETKQDLLILITPRILDEGEQPARPGDGNRR